MRHPGRARRHSTPDGLRSVLRGGRRGRPTTRRGNGKQGNADETTGGGATGGGAPQQLGWATNGRFNGAAVSRSAWQHVTEGHGARYTSHVAIRITSYIAVDGTSDAPARHRAPHRAVTYRDSPREAPRRASPSNPSPCSTKSCRAPPSSGEPRRVRSRPAGVALRRHAPHRRTGSGGPSPHRRLRFEQSPVRGVDTVVPLGPGTKPGFGRRYVECCGVLRQAADSPRRLVAPICGPDPSRGSWPRSVARIRGPDPSRGSWPRSVARIRGLDPWPRSIVRIRRADPSHGSVVQIRRTDPSHGSVVQRAPRISRPRFIACGLSALVRCPRFFAPGWSPLVGLPWIVAPVRRPPVRLVAGPARRSAAVGNHCRRAGGAGRARLRTSAARPRTAAPRRRVRLRRAAFPGTGSAARPGRRSTRPR